MSLSTAAIFDVCFCVEVAAECRQIKTSIVTENRAKIDGVAGMMDVLLASERSERDTLRSVQSRIAIYICIIVCMSLLPFDL